jgi:chaperonin GroEL
MKEKKDRVDDALAATRAAVEEGIVVGGGVALVRAMEGLDNVNAINEDEKTGVAIVKRALEAPVRIIAENAGVEGSVVLMNIREKKGSYGFNARTEEYEDLKKAGVIDPLKVTRIALENASSIAGMVLTTECVINDLPEPKDPAGHGMPPGGMGGMM